jgi:hypothetical protein
VVKRRVSGILAFAPVALAVLLLSGCTSAPASTQSMAFGTGGTLCDLPAIATTFAAGSKIRMTAHFSPGPTSVTAHLIKDGSELGSSSVDLHGDNNCAAFELGQLPAGHYKMSVTTVPASQMPALTGEFDVTS